MNLGTYKEVSVKFSNCRRLGLLEKYTGTALWARGTRPMDKFHTKGTYLVQNLKLFKKVSSSIAGLPTINTLIKRVTS